MKLIKSKERVKKHAEVFTPEWVVKEMLDNLKDCDDNYIKGSFFEPSFGTGNFLVEILRRKLNDGINPFTALKKIYGVELLQDNVDECKERLRKIALEECEKIINEIMDNNLLQGDFLNEQDRLKFKDWDTGEVQSLTEIKNNNVMGEN